jgi:hypothetical protein
MTTGAIIVLAVAIAICAMIARDDYHDGAP